MRHPGTSSGPTERTAICCPEAGEGSTCASLYPAFLPLFRAKAFLCVHVSVRCVGVCASVGECECGCGWVGESVGRCVSVGVGVSVTVSGCVYASMGECECGC